MNYTVKGSIGTQILQKGMSVIQALILENRGITNVETHVRPSYENDIYNPLTITSMEQAVIRILEALEKGEKIAVYSDYDCDGIPGATVFSDFFKKIGYENIVYYIPHRHKEGYGIHLKAIDSLCAQGVTLMITVDLGITNIEEVAYAESLNINVIVTDHHLPHVEIKDGVDVQILPKAYAVINTKKTGETYPEKMLCGCATAWKVVCALIAYARIKKEEGNTDIWNTKIADVPVGWEKWSLDMVGLSTIADMVPLLGENRTLAHFGLKVLRKSKRPGLKSLLKTANTKQEGLTEEDVGFTIGPRLNAASRMDTPELAFTLLSTVNPEEGYKTAKILQNLNTDRKESVSGIMKSVHKQIQSGDIGDVIVIGSGEWSAGVLGLIASKVLDTYARPVFVWGKAEEENMLKGSCRSDGSVSVVDLMLAVPKHIFLHTGGHEMAGGFTLFKEHVHTLETHILDAFQKTKIKNYIPTKNVFIDCELPASFVNYKTVDEIDVLAPYGVGYQKPTFLFSNVEILSLRHFGKENNHLELEVNAQGTQIKVYGYFMGAHSFEKKVGLLEIGKIISVVGNIERELYGSRRSVRVRIVDVI